MHAKYTISFNNACLSSNCKSFSDSCRILWIFLSGETNEQYVDDDGAGNIRTFYLLGGTTKTITNANAGTINYVTGEIVLTSFNITVENTDGTLDITVKPDSNDVIPVRNQIIEIDIVGSSTYRG